MPSHQALERAAHWFALLLADQTNAQHQRDWQTWLRASQEHRQAWAYVERLRTRLDPIHASPAPRLVASAWNTSQSTQRRRTLLGLITLTGTSSLGYLTWRHTPLADAMRIRVADYTTRTAEMREVALTDGSRVWLNADSAMNLNDAPDLRSLHLLRGEVFIITARDPRPFQVQTPQGLLRALGTRFAVRLEDDAHTLLVVYEGAVGVQTRAGSSATVVAGAQRRFTTHTIFDNVPADPAREAWRRGILIARDLTLAQVVAQLRAHHHGHLGLAPELAHLRIFGSYPLHDTRLALSMLESVIPVHVQRPLPWWTSIVPRR